MKRVISLILALIMVLSFAACTPSKPVIQDDPLEPGEIPAVGQVLNGFKVLEVHPGLPRDTTLVYMEHEKTGAKLVYAANDDTNRNFTIGFNTPAENDKGIPHIFEHSCLGGSEKYPDSTLFFTMIASTYNTYLNAATYPTGTVFPASSLSEDQLFADIDYILNGVFYPLVLTDERAMMREAYRYELDSPEGELSLVGTVYSEMMGYFTVSNLGEYSALKEHFPGSYTVNVSGGDPRVIPELSHEELVAFHDKYYHPSNCCIVLYGKLDLQYFLKHIDEEFFSKFDRAEVDLTDKNYVPIESYKETTVTFPVAADSSEHPLAFYYISLPGLSIDEENLLLNVLDAMFLEGGAIEARRQLQMPNAIIGAHIYSFLAEPVIEFYCDSSLEDISGFKQLIDDAIADVLANGVNKEQLLSMCNQNIYTEFSFSQDVEFGLNTAEDILFYWFSTKDIDAYRKETEASRHLGEMVEAGKTAECLETYFKTPAASSFCVVEPEYGGLEKMNAALEQSLKDKKAAMSAEEIDALVARTADYKAWNEANNQSSMIDVVNVVGVQDIPEELNTAVAEDKTVEGMRFISSILEGDVVNVSFNFDLSTLPTDLIQYLNFYADLNAYMPTESHSVEELSIMENRLTAGLNVGMLALSNEDNAKLLPLVNINWFTTEENIEASYDYAIEKVMKVKFLEPSELRDRAGAMYETYKKAMLSDADELASYISKAQVSKADAYWWKLAGPEYLQFVKNVANMSLDEIAAVYDKMQEAISYAFTNKGFFATATGSKDAVAKAESAALKLYKQLPDNDKEAVDLSEFIAMPEGNIAVVVGGLIYNNYQAINLPDNGLELAADMSVATYLMKDRFLFPVLRFERGSYGSYVLRDYPVLQIMSHQDPNLMPTFDYFKQAVAELAEIDITQEELDGYTARFAANIATKFDPYSAAQQAITDAITGADTFGMYQKSLSDMKKITPEDIRATAKGVYKLLVEEGPCVTVGSADQIEANKEFFDYIDYSFVK